MKKTNLDMLMDSIERATTENIQVFKSGGVQTPGYIVLNGGNGYNVTVENNEVTGCTCPHHHFRGAICKHMVKVSKTHGLNIANLSAKISA